jgi:carbamoyl-phosphate synthase large subunit
MKTILVTAISGDVGNSILKCLYREGTRVFGTDVGDYPAGLDKVEKLFKVPYARDDNYMPEMARICRENSVTHLIPVHEQEIVKIACNKETFESLGVAVICLELRQLNLCMDKYLLPKKLIEIGLIAPKTFLPDAFCPDGKDYVVKLRHSAGSRLVEIIKTHEELTQMRKKYGDDIVVQEYIHAPKSEYTIGVFSAQKEIRSITFRRELKHGHSHFVELATDSMFQILAETAAKELNIQGCFNIQLRKYQDKYYIFEINPRISGTTYFRHQLGFEDVNWWINLASNEEISPYFLKYKKAIGVREYNEKFVETETI